MNTPICDAVRRYGERKPLRLHMPGHKGQGILGVEARDVTEIPEMGSLYEGLGVTRESEKNASSLFGTHTFYSAEGSSLAIRAMVYLAVLHGKSRGRKPLIAAGRNAHKAFLSAAALLDLEVAWLLPGEGGSYLSCVVEPQTLDAFLETEKPAAVYVTSPDYLGNLTDIAGLSRVCRRHDTLLLVDNAHGAYLKFLEPSLHPMDLGADLCCDSAHKTLEVLTGGAYLHISRDAPGFLAEQASNALALFGSTSPSYLILQSLDAANARLAGEYPRELARFAARVQVLKQRLAERGYRLVGQEPLKITVLTGQYGYTGQEIAELLRQKNIEPEFSDPEHLTLMLTPGIGEAGLDRLFDALCAIPPKTPLSRQAPGFHLPKRVLSIREAVMSPCLTLPLEACVGRILASPSVACPPAVPIVVCGEVIDETAAEVFRHYGICQCTVVRENGRGI